IAEMPSGPSDGTGCNPCKTRSAVWLDAATILHPVTACRTRRARPLHAPAALLLCRQIVVGQERCEPLALRRFVHVRAEEMARRQRHGPVSPQGGQAAPVA